MTSEVSIVNAALSHLGDEATVSSLDESSAQAMHARRFLPIARDTLLEMHPWSFALRRGLVAQLADWSDSAWPYAYARPANCLKVLAVLPSGYVSDITDPLEFACESLEDGAGVILTQVEVARARWIGRVTDVSKFSPLFVEALTWALASYIAGSLLQGESGQKAAQAAWAVMEQWLARAKASDANQARLTLDAHRPAWIGARD